MKCIGGCGGNEPSTEISAMTTVGLVAALKSEFDRDPWPNDWPTGSRGRQIKEELSHRRAIRITLSCGCVKYRGSRGFDGEIGRSIWCHEHPVDEGGPQVTLLSVEVLG